LVVAHALRHDSRVRSDADERRRLAQDQYAASTSKLDARAALHARFSIAEQTWHEWLFARVAPAPGDVLVELGAGTGLLWSANESSLAAGVRVHLTDLSMAMCRRLLADVSEATSVTRMNAERVAFLDDSADIVVANHMLYHVPDQQAALEEVVRVLRPGGRAVFATNGRNHMKELWEILAAAGVAGPDADATHQAFLLEDAQQIVAPFFLRARIETFEDGLRVTDPDAIIAYIKSFASVTADQSDDLRDEIAARTTNGYLTITKSAGVVTAIAA
jgi:ubiquinone/menaquinone biosynthesis C-methylase UbiE